MSEQERKRRRKEKKKEEKKRKKEKKMEEKKEEEEAAGGRGVKEEEPDEDNEKVKAETVEVAMEDVGGGGVLVGTPWLRGDSRPCMGPEPHQLAQCANPPPGAGNTGQWVLP